MGLRLHFQLKFNVKYILQKKCILQRKLFRQENLHCHQKEREQNEAYLLKRLQTISKFLPNVKVMTEQQHLKKKNRVGLTLIISSLWKWKGYTVLLYAWSCVEKSLEHTFCQQGSLPASQVHLTTQETGTAIEIKITATELEILKPVDV